MVQLVDLVDESGWHGGEMVEAATRTEIVRKLSRLAAEVRRDLATQGRSRDCLWASSFWLNALSRTYVRGDVLFQADPDDQVTLDGHRVTDDERGGYEVEGRAIKRHAWLVLGPELTLFDPTAHQFDRFGPPSVRRYWIQSEPRRKTFLEWRELERSGLARDGRHDQ